MGTCGDLQRIVQGQMCAGLFESFLECRAGVRCSGSSDRVEQLGVLAWSGVGWALACGVDGGIFRL